MKRKIFFIVFAIVLLTLIVFPIYIYRSLNTPISNEQNQVEFVVKEGESLVEISTNLKNSGLISNRLSFLIYFKIRQLYAQSGEYLLSRNLSAKSVANILSSGQTRVVKVTIPEGYRTEQIAKKFSDTGVIKYDDFIQKASESEGYLFPDTYFIHSSSTAEEVIEEMKNNFINRTAGLNINEKVIKLASIVEREAKLDVDRPKIAGVYQNRLNHNMKLEADPTVQYGKDTLEFLELSTDKKAKFSFWGKIIFADYTSVNSKFNTYLYYDLPPTAICNPGLKSIEAAISPTTHDYYYFLHTPDGVTYYARNAQEHELNKSLYLK
jgi:UPF0755 protein